VQDVFLVCAQSSILKHIQETEHIKPVMDYIDISLALIISKDYISNEEGPGTFYADRTLFIGSSRFFFSSTL
jgi:hypothetical protein